MKNKTSRKFSCGGRASNIELLRILSMFVIVAHHFVVNSGILEQIDQQTVLSLKDYMLLIFGWGGKTGINCFVFITGYFMCTSNITVNKFLKLLCEIYFYKIVIWTIFFISGYEAFSVKGFLKVIFPFFTVADNFTSCFLLFYLFIPFLNKLLHILNEKEHIRLMILVLFMYTILPTFAKANVVFNYVTWFMIIYVIASYVRLYPKKSFENVKVWGCLSAGTLALSWISVIGIAFITRVIGKSISWCYYFVSDSNKVLALATAVCCFMFFKNLQIRYSKVINTIAASTFGVLLIHANSDSMRKWLWLDLCRNVKVYSEASSMQMIGYALLCIVLIYGICTLIDMLRIKCIEKPCLHKICNFVNKKCMGI